MNGALPAGEVNETPTESHGLSGMRQILSDVPTVLQTSRTTRLSAIALASVLTYLLVGQAVSPGFTDYWWYQLFQTGVTLVAVLIFDAVFEEEGGMSWQTHVLIVGATLADTLGTAGHLYSRWGPYDKVVHFASGAAVAALAYQALRYVEGRGKLPSSPHQRAMTSVMVSFLLAGLIWELYEYLTDFVFTSGRVYGWSDTIGDVIAVAAGGIVAVSILGWSRSAAPESGPAWRRGDAS